MKKIEITSPEALDAVVGDIVATKIKLTAAQAKRDLAVAQVQKTWQPTLQALGEEIEAKEAKVRDYCDANRAALFATRKSRETTLAVFGFETTPPRVETANKKIKWKDVVTRLQRLVWGKNYLTFADPKPNKEAILADRSTLTPGQLSDAGIQIVQDEQFFLRPKPETAEDSTQAA